MNFSIEYFNRWVGSPELAIDKCMNRVLTKPHLIPINADCFGRENVKMWMRDFIVIQDLNSVKQYQYNFGRLLDFEYSNRKTKEAISSEMLGLSKNILTILLSDSSELIQRFTNWEYESTYQFKSVLGFGPIIKALLKKDNEMALYEYEKYYDIINLKPKGNNAHYLLKAKYYDKDANLMKAMIEGDEKTVKESILWMCSPQIHNRRIYHPRESYASNFFSVHGTAILKTMWLLGHEIEVDHPLIPMDLMPVEPLEKYEVPYFFLDGYEGDLPESYVQWLKEKDNIVEKKEEDNSPEFIWDKDKYRTRKEAVLVENAIEQGYLAKRNDKGEWTFYK